MSISIIDVEEEEEEEAAAGDVVVVVVVPVVAAAVVDLVGAISPVLLSRVVFLA
jgi:hypothetical protein